MRQRCQSDVAGLAIYWQRLSAIEGIVADADEGLPEQFRLLSRIVGQALIPSEFPNRSAAAIFKAKLGRFLDPLANSSVFTIPSRTGQCDFRFGVRHPFKRFTKCGGVDQAKSPPEKFAAVVDLLSQLMKLRRSTNRYG